MNIDIIFTANNCTFEKVKGKNAVVIDVLRATSVIVTALKNNAKSIITFSKKEEALQYAKNSDSKNIVLGGERKGLKIKGFDYGNSPLEYKKSVIEGKELLLTTSNGTRAIENAKDADALYIMCFLNINSIVRKLLREDKNVVFVCAGTDDKFTADDSLCAGLCIEYLTSLRNDLELSDASMFVKDYASFKSSNLHKALEQTKHYKYLKSIGHTEDLEYCLAVNMLDILPYYKNGKIYAN